MVRGQLGWAGVWQTLRSGMFGSCLYSNQLHRSHLLQPASAPAFGVLSSASSAAAVLCPVCFPSTSCQDVQRAECWLCSRRLLQACRSGGMCGDIWSWRAQRHQCLRWLPQRGPARHLHLRWGGAGGVGMSLLRPLLHPACCCCRCTSCSATISLHEVMHTPPFHGTTSSAPHICCSTYMSPHSSALPFVQVAPTAMTLAPTTPSTTPLACPTWASRRAPSRSSPALQWWCSIWGRRTTRLTLLSVKQW